jgi:hypothetical protein
MTYPVWLHFRPSILDLPQVDHGPMGEGARDPSDEVASEARHRRVWKGLWKV